MAAADQLAAAWQQQVAAVRARVVAVIMAAWQGLGGYRDADARRFAQTVAPLILAGQAHVQDLTRAYLTRAVAPALPVLAPLAYAQLRRGADPAEVYRRPFVDVWTALGQGQPVEQAVAAGERRLRSLAGTDLQLAKTHATARTLSRAQRATGQHVWYERTLTGAENCAMCVVASTQRYRAGDLMPIHPGCDCGVRPHTGPDPGLVIHPGRLEDLHDTLNAELGVSDRGGRAPDYRKVITTREHGEYGPTLTVARDSFTGPRDVPHGTRIGG